MRSPTRSASSALAIALLLTLVFAPSRFARAAYVQRFSTIANGGITFTGNTLGLSKATNLNEPGTADAIGAFIDALDGTQKVGTYPAGTTLDFNLDSSAALLRLPAGAVVLHAELVWGGSYLSAATNGPNLSSSYDKNVTLITPGGATDSVAPDPATRQQVTRASRDAYYVRSADVTAIVKAAGAGSYTVGGVAATVDALDNSDNTAGWTLEVAYGLASLPARSLTLFVGAEPSGAAAASVSGFCTPISAVQAGRIAVSALEGDPNKTGDTFLFGPTTGSLSQLSGPNNIANNFFAGQINGDTGNLDTSGTFGTLDSVPPAVGNGVRQGYDITDLDISPYLASNQQSAFAQGTTTSDFYVINGIGLQINVGAPSFVSNVKSVDKATARIGDTLNYTISFNNTAGTANANNVTLTDLVPPGTAFVANSVKVNGLTVAGADPKTGVNIGTVLAGTTSTATFAVTVVSVPASPAPAAYDNAATFTYTFQSCAGQPTVNGSITTNTVETTTARLATTKTVSPAGPIVAGQTLTYSIATQNTGLAATAGTTLADPIPAGTTYVANSTTLNGTAVADVAGAMPYATATTINSAGSGSGAIAASATATVAYRTKVNAAPGTATILNVASVDPDGSGPAPAATAQASNSVVASLLTLTKSVRNVTANTAAGTADVGKPGDVLEYRIDYSNATQQSIASIVFDDPTPASTTFVSATCGTAPLPAAITSCTIVQKPAVGATGNVRFSLGGALAPGAAGSLFLQVAVN